MSSAITSTSSSTSARIAWLDSVRGLAIILVVLYHATLVAQAVGHAHPAWAVVNGVVQTFRMPLFFFASGLLAANAITRPWRTVARGRLALYLWLFVLWSTIETLLYFVVPNVREGIPESTVGRFLSVLVVPDSGVWYLYALLLFVVLAKVTACLPASVVLAVTGVLSAGVSSDLIPVGSWIWESFLCYPFFFLAGARLKGFALTAAQGVTLPRALIAVAAFCLPTLAAVAAAGMHFPGVHLVLSILAVGAGVALCAWLTDHHAAGLLTYLGSLTLPIYVLHQMILNGLGIALAALQPESAAVDAVMPAALTVAAVPLCLMLRRLLRRVPGLFELPPMLAGPRAPAGTKITP